MTHCPELFRNDEQVCVVSPDAGGVNRAKNFKSYLDMYRNTLKNDFCPEEEVTPTNIAVLVKERN